uniref:Uncharacterized protein n=1 Tax=Utricularia reniformis TaxID=192314 RepID=A0A1Y0B364_9LAMI|nr:hypothetical protein AEK19_MT1639 [Utricularia reniformis]ART31823.1 hypothetical protein AEK19_MT1639 [Utricularia reniformis]
MTLKHLSILPPLEVFKFLQASQALEYLYWNMTKDLWARSGSDCKSVI